MRDFGQGRAVRVALLGMGLLWLAACGGGGGGGNVRNDPPPAAPTAPPPPPPPPPPATNLPQPSIDAHLSLTFARWAHSEGITGLGVTIGVIDSGIRRDHPALTGRVARNLLYIDPARNDLSVDDKVGHGTWVSQIAGGKPFGEWPGGIAPDATFVSARIISDAPPKDDGTGQGGNEVSGADGLDVVHQDLINAGAKIMNNSWGGLYWTGDAVTTSFLNAYRPFVIDWGGLVVFSTGNEGKPQPSDNASLPSQGAGASILERGWIAAAALDSNFPRELASYSNACGIAMNYCLVAPGNVVVTGKDDVASSPSYWVVRGTSFAAPQVSGAAALVWQKFPYFDNDLVRQTLLGTARDLGEPGVDPVFGRGGLDIGAAIRGPAKFDWGDVTVTFDGITSRWSNWITGTGGLIKRGTGTLILGHPGLYIDHEGLTRVQGGTLQVEGDMHYSSVQVESGGRLAKTAWLRRDLDNAGIVEVDDAGSAYGGMQVMGNYIQRPGGQLSVLLGNNQLQVTGTAQLQGGTLHVLGARSGFVISGRQNVLTAKGGLTGTFAHLTAAPTIFLEATLGYSATQAWLDVTRLDVQAAAQAAGAISPAQVASAARVESAFQELETPEPTTQQASDEFLEGAGAFQGTATATAAQRSLDSLSGELHGADTALAMMAIEGNRRALEARVDALRSAPVTGAWANDLKAQRALSQFDVDADGWMLGQDRRLGDRLTAGMAVAETDSYAHHDLRYDREHNRQVEAQFYGNYDFGRGYLLGNVALGRMQRWTQRDLLLGDASFRVEADYAHRYASAGLQAGLPIELGRGRITPYAGVQAFQLDRDGFEEHGGLGFGLSTDASTMKFSQGLVGARFACDWSVGSLLWVLQGRTEWQHLLSQSGGDIDARFSALDVWSPIVGEALDRDVGVFGMSLGTKTGRASRLSFDLDSRYSDGRQWTGARATWSMGW